MKSVPTRPQSFRIPKQPLDCIHGTSIRSHGQIAELLGISRQSVHATFTRINKRLRRALADLNPYKPTE